MAKIKNLKISIPEFMLNKKFIRNMGRFCNSNSFIFIRLWNKKNKKVRTKSNKNVSNLIVIENEYHKLIAFMGIEDTTLEMLFLKNSERGKELGKKLLMYGLKKYNINNLTVNEQNPQALAFYEHMGFKTYKRTELDEQGNAYPILYITLKR